MRTPTPELVFYGDMESGSGDPWVPTGWQAEGSAVAGDFSQDAVEYAKGPHSLHMDITSPPSQSVISTDNFTVVAGEKYIVSFWIKGVTHNLKALMKDGNGSTTLGVVESYRAVDYPNWTKVSFTRTALTSDDRADVKFRNQGINTMEFYVDQVFVRQVSSDSYFNPDPTERLSVVSDTFCNTIGPEVTGDAWFDVLNEHSQDTSWDILNAFLQSTAWDILNENNQDVAWGILNGFAQNIAWDILNTLEQDISWSVFARVLYYIQRFILRAICFDFNIKEPVSFSKQVQHPMEFTFYPTGVITETLQLLGSVSIDTVNIAEPMLFSFQIKEPITFTFGVSTVHRGSSPTENKG